ncbi:MAG: cold shock domain-containing protein [Proteobacteria bacterium]|nr:cold shock domain-containing protein [Pseudomonadota bacterium]
MLNVENRVIINPIELEGDTVFVPFQDEELEQEFLERRTAHGRVRWFKRSLGYGFVREDGCANEIFVHQSSIQVPGVKDLRPGQRILFEYCRTAKGEIALNVIPIMERPDVLERYHAKCNNSVG